MQVVMPRTTSRHDVGYGSIADRNENLAWSGSRSADAIVQPITQQYGSRATSPDFFMRLMSQLESRNEVERLGVPRPFSRNCVRFS